MTALKARRNLAEALVVMRIYPLVYTSTSFHGTYATSRHKAHALPPELVLIPAPVFSSTSINTYAPPNTHSNTYATSRLTLIVVLIPMPQVSLVLTPSYPLIAILLPILA